MIAISMVLVLNAFVMLLLGILGVGDEPLRFVYASIGTCLVAAAFLAAGVLRNRPGRRSALPSGASEPSWSGARPQQPSSSDPNGTELARSHVQVLSGAEAAADALGGDEPPDETMEHARFVGVLDGLDVDAILVERLRGRFLDVRGLASASVDDLCRVPGVSRPLAERIVDRMRRSA